MLVVLQLGEVGSHFSMFHGTQQLIIQSQCAFL